MEQPWITAKGVCDLWSVSDDIADDFDAWTHQLDLSYAAGVIPKGGPGGATLALFVAAIASWSPHAVAVVNAVSAALRACSATFS